MASIADSLNWPLWRGPRGRWPWIARAAQMRWDAEPQLGAAILTQSFGPRPFVFANPHTCIPLKRAMAESTAIVVGPVPLYSLAWDVTYPLVW